MMIVLEGEEEQGKHNQNLIVVKPCNISSNNDTNMVKGLWKGIGKIDENYYIKNVLIFLWDENTM